MVRAHWRFKHSESLVCKQNVCRKRFTAQDVSNPSRSPSRFDVTRDYRRAVAIPTLMISPDFVGHACTREALCLVFGVLSEYHAKLDESLLTINVKGEGGRGVARQTRKLVYAPPPAVFTASRVHQRRRRAHAAEETNARVIPGKTRLQRIT